MEFVVDKVFEDSFYENLLLGLPKILETLPGIYDQHLERNPPAHHNNICSWEQKHSVLLLEDLRCFYASTNGLLFSYKFSCSDDPRPDSYIVQGKIEINSLNDLQQIYGYEIKNDPGVNTETERYELRLGPDSKLFELVNLNNIGRVTLVYINPRYLPTIWVHNTSMQFFFLADDFTTYLKMCIHHLGIPFWQFAYTSNGVPEWTEMLFRLLAPSLLPLNRKLEDIKKDNEKIKNDEEFLELPINNIDGNIFRTTPKSIPPPTSSIKSVPETHMVPMQSKKKSVKSKMPLKFQRKPLFQKK